MSENSRILAAAAIASMCAAPLAYLLLRAPSGKSIKMEAELKALTKRTLGLKDELDIALFKFKAAESEIQKLETNNSGLKLQLEAEAKKMAKKDVTIRDLQQQIEAGTSTASGLHKEVKQFKAYVQELQSQLKDHVEKFERAITEKRELQHALESKTKSYEALMGSNQTEVASLNLVITELKAKVNQLQASLNNANGTISKFKSENDTAVRNYNMKLTSLEEEASKSAATIQTLESKLGELRKECQTLTKGSNEREAEINGLKQSESTLQAELKQANHSVKKLQGELSSSAVYTAQLEAKFEALQNKHQADRRRLAELAGHMVTFVSGSPEEIQKLKIKIKEGKASPELTQATPNGA